MKAIKCNLGEIMDRLSVSSTVLMLKTEISRTQIDEYVSFKRKMSLDNAALIAKVLDVHIEDLYEWDVE
jgi:plasmid maintenance system antidote protein VapI